ncbi:hypothetical protein [Subtercola endophyticus]|uniref:hypothetical protein n=1 Tax=Subtercola endophyticus TaxID=2895559 RepID=UPI001E56201B|nr:hypothetical protein [Subtercola endophyticus]UFS59082.1 hypothetical protein LQ955_19225 [Subtercola endophyticus]
MTGYTYLGPATTIEVPVRSATLPINIWQRTSYIAVTSSRPAKGTNEVQGDWQRGLVQIDIPVAAGDTVLYAYALLTIAGGQRREQGFFDLGWPDTNDWSMAFDGAEPLTQPFTGPGTLALWGKQATRGNAWPSSTSVIVDALILRAGLVPDDPPPFTAAVPTPRSFVSQLGRTVDWQTYDPFRH